MKVLHVTPAFHPAYRYGGPAESVYQLSRGLVSHGCQVRVLTTNSNGPGAVLDVETGVWTEPSDGVSVLYCRRWLREDLAPWLAIRLPGLVQWADIVHLTMVYSLTTIPTLLACRSFGKPLFWSPRGSLQRWSGSTRVRLKREWDRFCTAILPDRAALHVTSEEEAVESRAIYPSLDAVVIRNGVEAPLSVNRRPGNGSLRIVYIGRLHPKKGLENLIEACAGLDSAQVRWSLTIAGAGDAKYAGMLNQRINALAISDRTRLIGEVTGARKTELFESADLAAFPSFTENFGLVVAEALAHGVPVIASRGMPWGEITSRGCGLWVDNDPRTLREAIVRASMMPLDAMGRRGREWMLTDFAWSAVARETLRAYDRLTGPVAAEVAAVA